jgi:tetratricopeptide (TPR) repeat protein
MIDLNKTSILIVLLCIFYHELLGNVNYVADSVVPAQVKMLLQKAHLAKDTPQLAQQFQLLGQYYYDKQPNESLINLDSATFYFDKMKRKKEKAVCLQNMAFLLEEQLKISYISLKYTKESLQLWQEIDNPLAQANLLKYMGLLYGNLEQYDKAFEVIEQSIQLFRSHHYLSGVAVCHIDLAMVYKKQTKYELAKKYMLEAKKHWEQQKDTGRIFGINNALIELGIVSQHLAHIQSSIAENQDFVNNNLYWKDILDFYTHCTVFYSLIGDNEKRLTYTIWKNAV